MTKPRVRFAPSPTGFLHIGGARTALFNWLYARHTGGTFILRVEDTDAARNTQQAVEVIFHGLQWLGLDWEEGPVSPNPAAPVSKGSFGPYFQSQRRLIYQARVEELIRRGSAYEQDGAVRFRMTREPITISDLVAGTVTRPLTDREELDPDFVIVRSDGQPVFHLVNVVDDIEMRITHVIRGEDHLSNTAKHIALFRAFGVEPPQYAHIPLILNSDGSKMGKRDVGASLTTYMEDGYIPEAVVNYLALLGWSPKENRELIPIQEMIERFDLPQVLRHNARFDMDKLLWMEWEHMKQLPLERFVALGIDALEHAGIPAKSFSDPYISAALATCKEKIKVFTDLPQFADFYFLEQLDFDSEAARQIFVPANKAPLQKLRQSFADLPVFNAEALQQTLKQTASALGVKAGALVHPVRLACTGKTVGPSLYHLLEVLGKERALARVDRALEMM